MIFHNFDPTGCSILQDGYLAYPGNLPEGYKLLHWVANTRKDCFKLINNQLT